MMFEVKNFKCDGFPTNDDIRKICFTILSHNCIVRLEYCSNDAIYCVNIRPGTNFQECKDMLIKNYL